MISADDCLRRPEDRLWRPEDRFRQVIPEQRIAGLRPANPERRIAGLWPASPAAVYCGFINGAVLAYLAPPHYTEGLRHVGADVMEGL